MGLVFLLLLCWILLVFEPYGMRLRQVVMNKYNPNRANERATWLYNTILRRRESFVKFARRETRRIFLKDKEAEKRNIFDVFRAKYNQ